MAWRSFFQLTYRRLDLAHYAWTEASSTLLSHGPEAQTPNRLKGEEKSKIGPRLIRLGAVQ